MITLFNPLFLALCMVAVEDPTPQQQAAKQIPELPKSAHYHVWVEDEKADANDPKTARWMLDRLVALGKPAVPALIEALKNGDVGLQDRAALVLSRIGPDAVDAVPTLIGLLEFESSYMPQRMAGVALVKLGAVATPALLDVVANGAPEVRWKAIDVLAAIRPIDPRTPVALVKLLADKESSVDLSASAALINIGEPSVAPLISFLAQEQTCSFYFAYKSLGEIGPAARGALSMLKERQKTEKEGGAREQLDLAIQFIEVARVASEAMSDTEKTRITALQFLSHGFWQNGCTQAEGDAVVQALVANLKHKKSDCRGAAAKALEHAGKWADVTLSPLLAVAMNPREDLKVRQVAIVALGTLRASGAKALPELKKLAKSSGSDLRKYAARAIERIEHPDKSLGCDA